MSTINGVGSYIQSNSTTSIASANSEQSMFLTLLVEQLKNQDPLEPMDNQEFVAQMAQFSSLEELQSINSNLAESTELDLILTQSINNTMAATLIGKEISALGDHLAYNGDDPVNVQYHLGDYAEQVSVTIRDADNQVVRVLTEDSGLAAGSQTLNWDGRDAEGNRLEAGTYAVEITAKDGNGNSIEATTMMTGIVSSVRFESGNAILVVSDIEISYADVLEISQSDE
ncbi:MAG: flagellar hook capping FlgD N-terminal domain-containing protein [Candidatus Neomarinimicrobiota bacterium]